MENLHNTVYNILIKITKYPLILWLFDYNFRSFSQISKIDRNYIKNPICYNPRFIPVFSMILYTLKLRLLQTPKVYSCDDVNIYEDKWTWYPIDMIALPSFVTWHPNKHHFRSYYKGVAAAIIVYDVTQRSTFNEVESWLQDCLLQCEPNTTTVLLANKCDIAEKRQVSTEVCNLYSREYILLLYIYYIFCTCMAYLDGTQIKFLYMDFPG